MSCGRKERNGANQEEDSFLVETLFLILFGGGAQNKSGKVAVQKETANGEWQNATSVPTKQSNCLGHQTIVLDCSRTVTQLKGVFRFYGVQHSLSPATKVSDMGSNPDQKKPIHFKKFITTEMLNEKIITNPAKL